MEPTQPLRETPLDFLNLRDFFFFRYGDHMTELYSKIEYVAADIALVS